MPRTRIILCRIQPRIICIAVALLNVSCASIGVSCNLGAGLDSLGKKVPLARQTGAKYKLNDKLYTECEVHYSPINTPMVQFKFGHLHYWNEHSDTPETATERYLLAVDENESIPAKAFAYNRATRSTKPKCMGHGVPYQYCTRFHPLSADFDDSRSPTQVNFLPEQRTLGNYMRTPLVALVSWGVDVPLTLAGNAVLYTLTGFYLIIDKIAP